MKPWSRKQPKEVEPSESKESLFFSESDDGTSNVESKVELAEVQNQLNKAWFIKMCAGAFVVLLVFVISFQMLDLSRQMSIVVHDGKQLLKPGADLRSHAIGGMGMAGISFLAICGAGFLGPRKSQTFTLMVVFVILSLGGLVYAFSSFSRYQYLLGVILPW